MPPEAESTEAMDPGLVTLGLLLRLHGVATELEQIRRRCGTARVGIAEILRGAKKFGLKARMSRTNWDGLAACRLPCVAVLRDDSFLFIGRVDEAGALVLRPPSRETEVVTKSDLEAVWDGRLVSAARRASLSDLAHRLFHAFIGMTARTLRLARSGQSADDGPVEQQTDRPGADSTKVDDSGLGALVILLRCHGIGAEAKQIRHKCGTATIGITEMLRCAKELGLKARAPRTNPTWPIRPLLWISWQVSV